MTREFLTEHNVLGICFVECGNAGAGYGSLAKHRFEACVKAGFEDAGATERGAPIFLWPSLSEEVVAVFRAGVPVRQLPLQRGLCKDQKWRSAQVVDLVYADDVHVRIINSHQPSSDNREFKYIARLQVMQSLIRLASVSGRIVSGRDHLTS